MNVFLGRYGRELHGRKPIVQFMDPHPLVVEYNLPVEQVSQKLTDRMRHHPEQDFIVTRNGEYLGIGRLVDLLEKITELQIQNASHANPLTLLPGNVPINQRMDELLRSGRSFAVCYCDLDNFKPFNDVYGYSAGDEVIKLLAAVIRRHCDPQRDFVGHVGGDDFVVMFLGEDWEAACGRIVAEFRAEAERLYTPEHRRDGGIWGEDRQGHRVFFPILSVSIGAVLPDPQACASYHDVAVLASDSKHHAKQGGGNCLFVNRRRAPHKV